MSGAPPHLHTPSYPLSSNFLPKECSPQKIRWSGVSVSPCHLEASLKLRAHTRQKLLSWRIPLCHQHPHSHYLEPLPCPALSPWPEEFPVIGNWSYKIHLSGGSLSPNNQRPCFADDFCGFAEMYPDFAEDYLYPDQTHFDSCAQTPPAPTPNGFCIDFSPENSDFGRKNFCKKVD